MDNFYYTNFYSYCTTNLFKVGCYENYVDGDAQVVGHKKGDAHRLSGAKTNQSFGQT